jgi:ribosomal protein S24E
MTIDIREENKEMLLKRKIGVYVILASGRPTPQ